MQPDMTEASIESEETIKRKRLLHTLSEQHYLVDLDIEVAKRRRLLNIKQSKLDKLLKNVDIIDPRPCTICLENPAEYIIANCGHKAYCQECPKRLTRCSICKMLTNQCTKIYDS